MAISVRYINGLQTEGKQLACQWAVCGIVYVFKLVISAACYEVAKLKFYDGRVLSGPYGDFFHDAY
jgi:hypothetical protein